MPRPELSTLRYPNLWQGCVGAWCPSQSGATGYRLFDDSGNNNHGVLTGTTPNNWTSDEQKLSISYTGLGVSSRMPQTPVLNLTGPLTVCTWLKYSLAQGNRGIVAKSGDATQYHISTGSADNRTLAFTIRSGATNYGVATNRIYNDNVWHFVAGVYDKNNVIINIDGGREIVIGPSVTGDIDLTNPALFIGCFNNGGGSFVGLVDDTRIYNRALAPYEIRQLASSRGAAYERSRGRKKAYVPGYRITAPSRIQTGSARTIDGTDTESLSRGLIGAWCPSLGASGYRLIDRSGNNNHGVLTGMDPNTSWIPSRGKLALGFDGVNDYVTTNLSCVGFTSLDYSAWIYRASSSENCYVGCSKGGNTGPRANLSVYGSITYLAAENTTNAIYGQVNNSRTGWNHFHYSFSGNAGSSVDRLKFWINGVEQSLTYSGTVPSFLGDVGVFELGRAFGQNLYGTGLTDDVRVWKRRLTASEIRLLYTGGRGVGLLPEAKPKRARIVAWDNQDKISVPARVLTNTDSLKRGLVGHWSPSLSGPQGNRLMDLSGQNNHGTLTNMDYQTDYVPSTDKGGRMALDFDNTNDSLNCSHINAIDSGLFSVSFWYIPAFVTGLNQMFGQWNSGLSGPIAFRNGAAISWQVGDSSSRVTSANVLSVGRWVHIVCIRDSVLRIAINGQMDAATATPGTQNNSEPFIIAGAIAGAGTGNGACGIDDFRIYNRVLTPNEIRLLAQSRMPERATPQRTRTVFYSSGLVSYLRRRTYNSILGSGVLS